VDSFPTIEINGETFVLIKKNTFDQLLKSASSSDLDPAPEETFGDYLRRIRGMLNLTAAAFAEKLGTTQAQITRIELGQKPQSRTEKRLAEKIRTLVRNRSGGP
jgi:DNA-binding transcriptional regulator YiaG